MNNQTFSYKRFTSFLLAWTFVVAVFSGAILYASPQGRVAHWANWTLLALDKEQWVSIHVLCTAAFLIGGIFHLLKFNWKVFLHYFNQGKSRVGVSKELVASLLLVLAVILGTLSGIPPFSTVIQGSTNMKAYWEAQVGAAPVPHMELQPLAEVARGLGMEPAQAIQILSENSLMISDSATTLQTAAIESGLSPREIYEMLTRSTLAKPRTDPLAKVSAGLGRKTVTQVSQELGIDVVAALKEKGIEAEPSETMRELASRTNQSSPHALLELIVPSTSGT